MAIPINGRYYHGANAGRRIRRNRRFRIVATRLARKKMPICDVQAVLIVCQLDCNACFASRMPERLRVEETTVEFAPHGAVKNGVFRREIAVGAKPYVDLLLALR